MEEVVCIVQKPIVIDHVPYQKGDLITLTESQVKGLKEHVVEFDYGQVDCGLLEIYEPLNEPGKQWTILGLKPGQDKRKKENGNSKHQCAVLR